jgi:hypothetical protein
VGGHRLLGHLGQAVPQTPPVRRLPGGGQSPADGFGIGGRPITHDDLHAGMLTQPVRQGVGLAVGQNVDALVGIGIDHDTGIPVTTQKREIVDTEHPRHRHLRQRDAHQDPDGGVTRQPDRQCGPASHWPVQPVPELPTAPDGSNAWCGAGNVPGHRAPVHESVAAVRS